MKKLRHPRKSTSRSAKPCRTNPLRASREYSSTDATSATADVQTLAGHRDGRVVVQQAAVFVHAARVRGVQEARHEQVEPRRAGQEALREEPGRHHRGLRREQGGAHRAAARVARGGRGGSGAPHQAAAVRISGRLEDAAESAGAALDEAHACLHGAGDPARGLQHPRRRVERIRRAHGESVSAGTSACASAGAFASSARNDRRARLGLAAGTAHGLACGPAAGPGELGTLLALVGRENTGEARAGEGTPGCCMVAVGRPRCDVQTVIGPRCALERGTHGTAWNAARALARPMVEKTSEGSTLFWKTNAFSHHP